MKNFNLVILILMVIVVTGCSLAAPELEPGAENVVLLRRCPPHNINWHTSIHQEDGCPYDWHYRTMNPSLKYDKQNIATFCAGEGQKVTGEFIPECNQVDLREDFLERVDKGECKSTGKRIVDSDGKVQYSKIPFKPAMQDSYVLIAAKNSDRKNYYENWAKNAVQQSKGTHGIMEFNASSYESKSKSGPSIMDMQIYPFVCK